MNLVLTNKINFYKFEKIIKELVLLGFEQISDMMISPVNRNNQKITLENKKYPDNIIYSLIKKFLLKDKLKPLIFISDL